MLSRETKIQPQKLNIAPSMTNLTLRKTFYQEEAVASSPPAVTPTTSNPLKPWLWGIACCGAIAAGLWIYQQGQLNANAQLAQQTAEAQAQLSQIQSQLDAVSSLVCGGK
ncbi:MAG: hypothetical protein WBB82_13935 [Limnothrix sp.]